MLHFCAIGVALGLSAGFAPGPLTALVISETLRHDLGAGVRVALAPFVTDLPIILFCLAILTQLPESDVLLAAISFCGAVFIGRMGLENLNLRIVDLEFGQAVKHSFRRGIVTNFLSPHPYIFWLTVGMPIIARAMRVDILSVAGFLFCFYLLLVGSKVLLALLVAKSRNFLSGRRYTVIMRLLGILLIGFAAALFAEGLRLLLAV
ncbi:MAG TPA: LysE family transporter [Desulfopila sp.]|nr:LysE family transporter [Desulfopila sp.]